MTDTWSLKYFLKSSSSKATLCVLPGSQTHWPQNFFKRLWVGGMRSPSVKQRPLCVLLKYGFIWDHWNAFGTWRSASAVLFEPWQLLYGRGQESIFQAATKDFFLPDGTSRSIMGAQRGKKTVVDIFFQDIVSLSFNISVPWVSCQSEEVYCVLNVRACSHDSKKEVFLEVKPVKSSCLFLICSIYPL